MSGIKIIRTIMIADATVTGLVPTSRIKAMPLPQESSIPAIGLSLISSTDRNIINEGATVRVSDRIQVTVFASNFPDKEPIIDAIRKACRYQIGSIGGKTKVVVLTDGRGPDLYDEESGLYMATQDFLVTYNESTS